MAMFEQSVSTAKDSKRSVAVNPVGIAADSQRDVVVLDIGVADARHIYYFRIRTRGEESHAFDVHEVYFGRSLIRILHRGASRISAGDEPGSIRLRDCARPAFLVALNRRAVPSEFHRVIRGRVCNG